MSGSDLVTLLAWVGTGVLALCIAAWARYFMIRYSAEDEVARLRFPVGATVALLVVLAVLVVAEPPSTT